MPLINVRLIDGVFSDSQKQQIVSKLADAMVSIEGGKGGDWGIGGKSLATVDVKALAAGKVAQPA